MKSNADVRGCADLHTHSTASDGTFSPSELVLQAKKAGLRAIALTDHDTLSGLREFCFTCRENGIEGIPGVEIGAKYKSEMHILGLFVDYENPEFAAVLEELSRARAERNYKMLEKFQQDGFDLTEEDILSQKGDRDMNSCGRVHFAAVLVKKGYAADHNDAFARFIGRDQPYYVKRKAYPPDKVIQLIHSAGGLAVLAHPIYISKDERILEKVLAELCESGLDGLESYYSQYTPEFTEVCLRLCEKFDLLPTGGSDFHGKNKPNIPIGVVDGGMGVPYRVVEDLKKRR